MSPLEKQYKSSAVVLARAVSSIVDTVYVVINIIGLAKNDSSGSAMTYGCIVMVACTLGLAIHYVFRNEGEKAIYYRMGFAACLSLPFYLVYAVPFGAFSFQDYTGHNVIQYARAFGPTEWLSLPLLLRVIYFDLWFGVVFLCVAGILLVLFAVVVFAPNNLCKRILKSMEYHFTKPRRPEPLVAISTNPPLIVAQ